MKNLILEETIQIFKSSDEKNLNEATQRGLHNDMSKLFDKIENEINSLPPKKREMVKNLYLNLLKNHASGGISNDNFTERIH